MRNEVEKYEITYLCEEGNSAKDATKVLETVGAKISKETDLGIKKLAYPINKMTTAHYGVVLFEIEKTELPRLEKALKLNKTIVRYLIVKELRIPIPKAAKKKVSNEAEIAPKVTSEKKTVTEEIKEKTEIPEIIKEKADIGAKTVEKPVLKEEAKPAKIKEKVETPKDTAESTKKETAKKVEKPVRKKPAKAEFVKEELDKKLEELTLD